VRLGGDEFSVQILRSDSVFFLSFFMEGEKICAFTMFGGDGGGGEDETVALVLRASGVASIGK